jgi:glycosyltransferase involved in cell wall biosynthesis
MRAEATGKRQRVNRDRRLRILAHLRSLEPLGGVELCVLQDSLALAGRRHQVDIMFGADGVLRAEYEASGVGLEGDFSFDFRPRRAVRDLAGYVPAARLARRHRPDVLWLNRFEHIVWGQAVARSAGCALICHLHDLPMFRRLRQLSHGVSHFIAVSDFVRDAYVDGGVDPAKITTVHNAIPLAKYPVGGPGERRRAREQLDLPPDEPIVLCYGQMTAEKGVSDLLVAWSILKERGVQGTLVMVGSPPPGRDSAVRRGLESLDPRFYRTYPMTLDVVPFLHASDVVAFPTRLPETFGRVVVEGMATGRPVVASRVGAVPEVLSGPMVEFLVEPGSPGLWADKLEPLLDWRIARPSLGADCAEWVARRFPFTAHVDAVERILLEHRRRR